MGLVVLSPTEVLSSTVAFVVNVAFFRVSLTCEAAVETVVFLKAAVVFCCVSLMGAAVMLLGDSLVVVIFCAIV